MSDAHHDEIAKLESLYAEHPDGRVFTHLAEAYRKAGELGRAEEVLSDGLEQHPEYSSAHVVLGRVLMDQNRTEEADRAFRRVLEMDHQNLIAIRSLGDLARARGDNAVALDYYQQLLDYDPADAEVRAVVDELAQAPASSADEGSEPAEPAGDWGHQQSASPAPSDESADDVEVRTETIAQVYARQGLYDRAAEVYRELVRARPDDQGLRDRLAEMDELAEAQLARADEIDAVADFDAADAQEPDTDEVVLEGFETTELDTVEVESPSMSGLETHEIDLETGLREDAAPGTATPAEDLAAEEDVTDVTDVPEPPEEEEREFTGDEDTSPPDWLADIAMGEDVDEEEGAAAEADEVEADEAVWAGTDWSVEVEPETTPYAWDGESDEEEAAADAPPVRHYLGELLGWSQESAQAQDTAPSHDTAQPQESAQPQDSGSTPAPGTEAAQGRGASEDDDDDLEMFRSWLESLKQ